MIRTSGAALSSKSPIAYVDIRAFAHATEDTEKVLAAIRNVLPTESVDSVVFEKSNLDGYYGNPITLLETRIKDRNVAQAVFGKLASCLSLLDKELLSNEIMQHLDKGSLYLRIDKQSAYLKQFRLGSTDAIHFRMHFKKSNPEEVIETCRKFGLLP